MASVPDAKTRNAGFSWAPSPNSSRDDQRGYKGKAIECREG